MLPVTALLVDECGEYCPSIAAEVSADQKSLGIINEQTEKASQALTEVHDNIPQWLTALKWVGVIALVVGFVVFCLYYGGFISRWLGVLSPKHQTEAKLLNEALDDPSTLPQFAAAWRTDQKNNGAFLSVRKKEEPTAPVENQDVKPE